MNDQEKLVKPSVFFPWVTFILISGSLIVPGVYVLLTVWLASYGLYHLRGFNHRIWQPSLSLGALPVWWGLSVYVAVGVCLGLLHGYKLSYFEAYVPMLLAPLIINAVVVARPPVVMLWLSAVAAACLAGLVAVYQSLILDLGRAGGGMNNVIMFGDLSVVLAMFAAFGWIYWGRYQNAKLMDGVFFVGTVSGLLASLLSGTKGGWLSILMLAIVFVWLAFSQHHWFKRILIAVIAIFLIFLVGYLAPADLVVDRIVSGLHGAQTWFSTGTITDGSVSIRLEKWSQAIGMIVDKPLTGWTSNAIAELGDRLREQGAGEGWTQVENDFLQVGIVHGLPGMFSYLFLYFGVMLGFMRARLKLIDHPLWVGLATVGIMLVVLMLEFGLSVVVLGRNAFRHTFIVWTMLVLGYLVLLWQQRQQKLG